ncbi:MATE family efflux transporter, partial [Brevundimonas sp.]
VKRAGWIGMGVVAVLATIVGLVIWPTAGLITGAYSNDAAVLAIAAPALALATLFFVADAIQVVAAQAIRAAGDVFMPTVMHFISYGVVMIPLGFLLAPTLGVNGLVWAVIVASLISGLLLGLRFYRVAKRATLTSHQAAG